MSPIEITELTFAKKYIPKLLFELPLRALFLDLNNSNECAIVRRSKNVREHSNISKYDLWSLQSGRQRVERVGAKRTKESKWELWGCEGCHKTAEVWLRDERGCIYLDKACRSTCLTPLGILIISDVVAVGE